MSESPPSVLALSDAEHKLVTRLIETVLAAEQPRLAIRDAIKELKEAQQPGAAAALFESVAWRADVHDYWTYFNVAAAYRTLGRARDDARLQVAMQAARMQPEASGVDALYADIFAILRERGQMQAAAAVFVRAATVLPEKPPAPLHLAAEVFRAAGLPPLDSDRPRPAADARADRRVRPESVRPGWTFPSFGGDTPVQLRELAREWRRPGIDVAELPDAEVLLCNNTVAVLDRDGVVHGDLSITDYPELVRAKLDRLDRHDPPPARYEVKQAVLIGDCFPPPNLCHFLLDQIPRLGLYQSVGVEIGAVTVIGPDALEPFQRLLLRQAGVRELIGTNQCARVRVGRLFVSTNCRRLCHAADWGAQWAIDHARAVAGGRGGRGWRRLYVSRGDVTARQVSNEADVMALLDRHGFEAIQPGTMPYPAQVAAFQQASHVIGAHGAAMTHLILCPPGTHVLEMFHPLYGTSAFAMQAAAAGVNYAALIGRDAQSDAPEFNDPERPVADHSVYLARHMRVDLDVLAAYLRTVL